MKRIYSLICAIMVAAGLSFIHHEMNSCTQPVNPIVNIGEYIFCVEEAVGDRYNVRIRYSLKRHDGNEINPHIQFGSIKSSDGLRSLGGTIEYSLSEDRKTIWIEEEQSSSDQYHSKSIRTVTLEKLTFGENSNIEPIEGTWSASYRIQIDEEYTELLEDGLEIKIPENESHYYLLSSIQLSVLGIHMEMKVPYNDIQKFANQFEAYLLLKNGSVIDLDLHHSIRGNKAPFDATGETMFKESVELDEVQSLIVCGFEILVNN